MLSEFVKNLLKPQTHQSNDSTKRPPSPSDTSTDVNSEISRRFTVKYLNWIILITYLTIFLSSVSLFLYFNNVINLNQTNFIKKYQQFHRKSDFTKLEIEKIVENYLIERRKLNKFFYNDDNNFDSNKEDIVYSTIINTKLPYNLNHNNNKQNVQNERKIADHLDFNHHINSDNSINSLRLKRDTSNLFDDDENDLLDDEPKVEFFNPKMRSELEKKDSEVMKKTGQKGAAPGGDQWVWLTAYSRIPYDAITGYCRAAKEYCPPGPPGLPGIPGPKGNRGETGFPGAPGVDGREGKPGPRGPKGEVGFPGSVGLDGRDGVPGEPGLDGVPGRAGADGIPGKDGKDGLHGLDGKNGKDGKDGLAGPIGPIGPQGIQGPRGLSGPRGRPGKPGTNGVDGIPGICAWQAKVNGTNELLIPPSIATSENFDKVRTIVVREEDNLRLRCAANGTPKPKVIWTREDGKTISTGPWESSSVEGNILNITKVHRTHMGAYKCIADNGVPPKANQTYQVDVYFGPLIFVKTQTVYAKNGTTATLECEIEAFPEPVRYWERVPDGRLIEQNEYDRKYFIETIHIDTYKSITRLNITKVRPQDFGEYNCVIKNEIDTTRGVINLQDENRYVMRRPSTSKDVVVFGTKPPDKESYEDICGPPISCPECPTDTKGMKCKDTIVSLYDLVGNLEVKPTGNLSYPGLSNRTLDCVLYAVGKPVYHKFVDESYGAWLRDPMPKTDQIAEKMWTTKENDNIHLFEYNNKVAFRNNMASKTYKLQWPFKGNTHVVYNGSFYYYARDFPKVIRYDLTTDKQGGMKDIYKSVSNSTNYLYTTEYNLVDFNVDDNGLWVIYSTPDSNYTVVSKLDSWTLEPEMSWNISINHHKVGEMFIVCGVLYAIDSTTDRNTRIRLAMDLYHNGKVLEVHGLTFTNPFRKTTTVGYNHRTKELYSSDKGNQLTYPIRYHEIGYNQTTTDKSDDSNPQLNSGYDSFHHNN